MFEIAVLNMLLFLTLGIKRLKAKGDACSKSSKLVESQALCISKIRNDVGATRKKTRRNSTPIKWDWGEDISSRAGSQRGQSAKLLTVGVHLEETGLT